MPCDYSKYPKNWKTEIRPRILKRANNCCEFCNVKNYEQIYRGFINNIPVYQLDNGKIYNANNGSYIGENYIGENFDKGKFNLIKVILTIAHLDHDKENHEVKDERLKALCQRCHLVLDKEHHAENRRNTLNKMKGLSELF